MEVREAREHLEMVDRILARAGPQRFRPWATLLISIGTAAALLDAGAQWNAQGRGSWMSITGAVLMLLSYAYAIGAAVIAGRNAQRRSRIEAERGRIIGAVWLCIVVTAFAQPHLLNGWSSAAIWSVGAAIQMTIMGFSGDRRALAGASMILASIVAANYLQSGVGYVLAAGFIFGYVVPGISYALIPAADCDERG